MRLVDKREKVALLSELFGLINTYYVARDLPTNENNFFYKLEKCCAALELDYTEVKREFGLHAWDDM